jgi:uncharacterized protein with PIN domain
MKFIADEMVGKLARWMRLAGCDTVYRNPISDKELVEIAQRENRIILTRDRKLRPEWRSQQIFVATSENP